MEVFGTVLLISELQVAHVSKCDFYILVTEFVYIMNTSAKTLPYSKTHCKLYVSISFTFSYCYCILHSNLILRIHASLHSVSQMYK